MRGDENSGNRALLIYQILPRIFTKTCQANNVLLQSHPMLGPFRIWAAPLPRAQILNGPRREGGVRFPTKGSGDVTGSNSSDAECSRTADATQSIAVYRDRLKGGP